MIENAGKGSKDKAEILKLFPKSYSLKEFLGQFDNQGQWIDGVLTKILKERLTSQNPLWLIFDGPLDQTWTESIESMTQSHLNLPSGELLDLPTNVHMIFETRSMDKVSPALLAKSGLVVMEPSDFTWKTIFSNWFRKSADDPLIMKWRRGQEELIEGLFFWLVPPLLQLVMTVCRPVVKAIPNALMRQMVEYFSSTLSDAIGNLKERKYLRSWIQAGCVSSATWSVGAVLNSADKQKFDAKLRDVLMGRSASNPLPPILNNKFDALPPAEGLVFDFVFDFKARGQWKHWNDVVKNLEVPEKMSNFAVIPTLDTARFNHIYASSVKCKRPLLLMGSQGIGKSITVSSKLTQNEDQSSSYKYQLLPSSGSAEFKDWLLTKLTKRHQRVFGPPTGMTATILIDDLAVPNPDEFGDVSVHEQIVELLDTNLWYDAYSGVQYTLEDTSLIALSTLDRGVDPHLSERLVSRFNISVMSSPTEDSFSKIFSTTLGLEFKEQNYPPEVSGVIPSIIQSTYKVYTECRTVLLSDETYRPLERMPHLPDLRDVARVVRGCSSLPKEAAENKKLFTRLWVHEALRCFYDRLTETHEMDAVFNCIKHCVKTIFRENFDSAFEHLGKIDGQVTQVNLRNLLFGRYLPIDGVNGQFAEVQGFDQYEKVLQSVLKKHNDERPQQEINIIPIR